MSDVQTDNVEESDEKLFEQICEVKYEINALECSAEKLAGIFGKVLKFTAEYDFDILPRGKYDSKPEELSIFEGFIRQTLSTVSQELGDINAHIINKRKELLKLNAKTNEGSKDG